MATAGDIIKQARVYLNDVDKEEYQDAELITYLNDALSAVENVLADNRSSITLRSMTVNSTPAFLLYDFLKVERAEYDGRPLRYKECTLNVSDEEYSIIGDSIITGVVPVTLYYYKSYPRVESLENTVDIYFPLETALKDYIVIKALSRLEYSTQDESGRLAELMNAVVATARRRDGFVRIKRYV